MQKLDFPEFVEKKRGGIQKLMEVAHVLVGMTPPGSLIYGILDHGFDFFGFLENITNSQKTSEKKVLRMRFNLAGNTPTSRRSIFKLSPTSQLNSRKKLLFCD